MLVTALTAALLLTGCVADYSGQGSTTTPVPTPTAALQAAPASNAPLETTQASNKIPVYWIGRSDTDIFLYREFRDNSGNENPITTALRIMMSQKPLDHDFFTPWQNPNSLATTITGKNTVTVDISRDAFNSNLDGGMAQRAVQQLVYTATAAAASSGLIDSGQQIMVTILVDGHTGYKAFGQVKLGDPMVRDAAMVAPVWIIDPQEDVALPAGPIKFNGRSTDPSKKLHWQILRENSNGDKTSYLTGQTTASTVPDQGGAFNLTVGLGAGRYELRVSQVGPNGNDIATDTRSFNVR
ncbi:GerMN domain-containing protein [Arthrobacter sp. NA-172]|uniref:GerMN domain-containing protein n=1 Tax=Arthrobacter sp. NA-172 TaxID=3367524 RepID=UPI00375443E5